MIEADSELLCRYAREGMEEAFAALVNRHLALVYSAAWRQVGGDAHAAQDVTQKVFTLLARKARSLTGHTSLAGWLHATTRFVASEAMRTERRRRAREQEAHLMHELSSSDKTATAEWERLRPVIDEALGELKEPDREAILLRFFADLSFAAVGARLNVPENTARMRVYRALEKLQTQLARRGVTSAGAALAVVLAGQSVVAMPAGLATYVTGTALAGVAAAGGGGVAVLKILNFMSTTKITLGVAGAIVIAASAVTWQQRQETAKLRSEIVGLREQSIAVATLSEENRRLVADKVSVQEKASAEHLELEQLRAAREAYRQSVTAKAAALSRRTVEPAADRNAPGKSDLKPGMVSVDLMANVGRATATAAAQTELWATQHGDVDLAASAITFDPPERAKMEAFLATLPEKMRSEYDTPEKLLAFVIAGSPKPLAGVQLLGETQPDPDTVVHRVQVQYESGEVRQDEIKFHRGDDGWKQVISPSTVDRVITYFKSKQ